MTRQERRPGEPGTEGQVLGREREQARPLSLKAAGSGSRSKPTGNSVAPRYPTFLELQVVGQRSLLQRFLYYPKKGHQKIKIKIKSHKTEIPEKTQKQLGAGPWSISGADPLENPLPLQVGVRVVAAEALGVLAHVAALWAGLR